MHFIEAPDDSPQDVMNRVCDVLSFLEEVMTIGSTVDKFALTDVAQCGFGVVMRACIGSLQRIQAAPPE